MQRATATLRCCDLHNNAGGDWVGCIAAQLGVDGNLAADPQFCDPGSGDFRIAAASPCAPAQSGACGLIGALDPAQCVPNAVAPTTWGWIKVHYDRR